jgi:hypothetical protein
MSSSTQFISGISATDGAQIVAGPVNGPVYFGDGESECFSRLTLSLKCNYRRLD